MPRAACRLVLEVAGVSVDRLQDISEADAQAEGAIYGPLLPMGFNLHGCDPDDASMRSRYVHLWNTINGADSWEANPWVWVVEFRRVQR